MCLVVLNCLIICDSCEFSNAHSPWMMMAGPRSLLIHWLTKSITCICFWESFYCWLNSIQLFFGRIMFVETVFESSGMKWLLLCTLVKSVYNVLPFLFMEHPICSCWWSLLDYHITLQEREEIASVEVHRKIDKDLPTLYAGCANKFLKSKWYDFYWHI